MPWFKGDDKSWHHRKLRRVGRSGRGLFWDCVAFASSERSDGYIDATQLGQLECTASDPDLRALIREGLVHKTGATCRCIEKRGGLFAWPRGRGYLIHDFLDYNPSKAENDVAKAQKAELRDPALRAEVRARDFGRCRYCARQTRNSDRRGELGETLDHVDPAVAAGEANLVLACRSCNSAKMKRTPEQACMPVLDIAQVRAAHFADLGIPDPDLAHDSKPTQVARADAPGRDGSGRVGYGSGSGAQIGPPDTIRDSVTPNPYLRAGHGDPALEPPPPAPLMVSTPDPPRPARTRSKRPRTRKGRR